MIEIIGEPREATREEIEKFQKQNEEEQKQPAWKEAVMRTFLAGH